MYYISYISDHKIRNFSGSNLQRPEKQTKKSSLKKFLVSYNIFAIYTAVKHREIICEKKTTARTTTLGYNIMDN